MWARSETRRMIRPMQAADVDQVVAVHMEAFPGFFLTCLGPAFLREFYAAVAGDPSGLAYVHEQSGRISKIFFSGISSATRSSSLTLYPGRSIPELTRARPSFIIFWIELRERAGSWWAMKISSRLPRWRSVTMSVFARMEEMRDRTVFSLLPLAGLTGE